jgi:hypothetical protein
MEKVQIEITRQEFNLLIESLDSVCAEDKRSRAKLMTCSQHGRSKALVNKLRDQSFEAKRFLPNMYDNDGRPIAFQI